jgi:hypothetical protein
MQGGGRPEALAGDRPEAVAAGPRLAQRAQRLAVGVALGQAVDDIPCQVERRRFRHAHADARCEVSSLVSSDLLQAIGAHILDR